MNIPFQETWCILNLESPTRVQNMQRIEHDYHMNINYMYTHKKPYYKNVHTYIESIRTDWYDGVKDDTSIDNSNIYSGIFDCFTNHYNIIRQAYIRGMQSVLIIEDDIDFCVDENIINKVFENIPKKYDIIKFYNGDYHKKTADEYNIKFEIQKQYLQCTVMYALSRTGMTYFLNYYDKYPPLPADLIFYSLIDKYNIKIYSLIPQIVNHTSDYSTIVNK